MKINANITGIVKKSYEMYQKIQSNLKKYQEESKQLKVKNPKKKEQK